MQLKPLFMLIGTAILLNLPVSVLAEKPAYKYTRNHYKYMVNADGSYVVLIENAKKILKEDALDSLKQQSISYSTSVEKVEILDAYTLKANGKKIAVPKSNYQLEVNSGKDKANPAFSDRTTLSIIFPELAAGDTVVWNYKLTQTEPLFPNQFSEWRTFARNTLYDDVNIVFDLPETMSLRYKVFGLNEKPQVTKKGRKKLEFSYRNEKIVQIKNDWGDVYEFGKDPAYLISTFPSHASIAQAYGVRAKQKAAVTPRIQKLADEITRGKNGNYDQAKALYEWVAKNISYAGNCIGVGAVVPRDTSFVLDNLMGDCKDHATLLEALLAAKKIYSTQALINAGSVYTLPEVPVVSMVNHVMNYIPSLNLFADATSKDSPFGLLPDGESGKPILLVDGHKDGITTPVESHANDKDSVQADITIGADGSAKGNVVRIKQGRDALFANTEENFKKYAEWQNDKDQVEDYSKNTIKEYGFEGGTVRHHFDTQPKQRDIATTRVNFDVKGFINAGSLGAFNIGPVFSGSTIYSIIKSAKTTELPSSKFTCKEEHIEETYRYTLPENVKILAVPDNIEFSNAIVSFKAGYSLDDNVLTVTRKLDDASQGPVCEVKTYQHYKDLADKVMPNLKSQIVYKFI